MQFRDWLAKECPEAPAEIVPALRNAFKAGGHAERSWAQWLILRRAKRLDDTSGAFEDPERTIRRRVAKILSESARDLPKRRIR